MQVVRPQLAGAEMSTHRHDEPNEDTAMWRDYRQQQQARRRLRLPKRTQEILDLAGKNFRVEQLTEYQFRIDGALDLYPTHKRYHALKRDKRGHYVTAIAIANVVL